MSDAAGFNIKVGADLQQAITSLKQLQNALNDTGNAAEKMGGKVKEHSSDAAEHLKEFTGAALGIALEIEIFEKLGEAVKEFFTNCVELAEKGEVAITKFKNTLDNAGKVNTLGELTEKAAALAKSFGYLSEADVVGVFDKLTTYGKLTQKQIEDLTPVIINFAAKSGKDLPEASETIIKALEGQGRGLKQYGVNLDAGATVAQNLAVVMGTLKDKVEGAGEVFGESFTGKVKTAEQQLNILEREIGDGLLPVLTNIKIVALEGFQGIIEGAKTAFNFLEKAFNSIYNPAASALSAIDEQNEALQKTAKSAEAFGQSMVKANEAAIKLKYPDASNDKIAKGLQDELKSQEALLEGDKDRAFEASKLYTILGQGDKNATSSQVKGSEAIVEAYKKEIGLLQEKNDLQNKKPPSTDDPLKDLKQQIASLEALKKAGADIGLLGNEQLINLKLKLQVAEVDSNKLIPEKQKEQLTDAFQGEALRQQAALTDAFKNLSIKIAPKLFIEDKQDQQNVLNSSIAKGLSSITVAPDLHIKPSIKLDLDDPETLTELKKSIDEHLKLIGQDFKDANDKTKINVLLNMGFTLPDAKKIVKNLDLKQFGKEVADAVNSSLKETFSNAFETLGSDLGEVIAGKLTVGDLFSDLLNVLAQGLQDFGKKLIEVGVEMEVAQKALDSLSITPGLAIAAGIGLEILGGVLKSSVKSSPTKFADGGVVNRATLGIFGEAGPEAVIPLDKLPGLINNVQGNQTQFVSTIGIRGRELVAFISREQTSFGRTN